MICDWCGKRTLFKVVFRDRRLFLCIDCIIRLLERLESEESLLILARYGIMSLEAKIVRREKRKCMNCSRVETEYWDESSVFRIALCPDCIRKSLQRIEREFLSKMIILVYPE